MILWVKRGAAVGTGVFLTLLLLPGESQAGMVAGWLFNLALAGSEKFPSALRRLFPPAALAAAAALCAFGVAAGGNALWAALAAGASLVAWNAALFLHRWPGASRTVQFGYLRRLGVPVILGVGSSLSALALQGRIPLPFAGALLFALTGGALYLRVIGRPLQER